MNSASFLIFCKFPDDGLIRAETCREYISYLIKTLSIVAKQKVLLFTVKSFISLIRMRSSGKRWVRCVARMGDKRNV
jgi:hypothetical protein